MLAHAFTELPDECCGLLAGRLVPEEGGAVPGAVVVKRYPLVNAAHSPKEYESDPKSLLDAFKDMRQLELEMLAIYHSHPTSDPVPSRKDLERNFYGADALHFIISLKDPEPRLAGWWLTDVDFRPAEWEYHE
jgi:proteasome lid subunit RPN8/RPN11